MPVEILENQEAIPVSHAAGEVGAAQHNPVTHGPRTNLAPTAGERLDRGLEMDRKLREARMRVMQQRINHAHRVETHSRTVCMWAGLGTILVWMVLLAPVVPIHSRPELLPDLLRVLAILLSLGVGIGLPVASVTAVLAGRWRMHLLRAAAAQHLDVRDPGQIDYP